MAKYIAEPYCPVHGTLNPVEGECCPGVLDAPHNRAEEEEGE